MAVKMERVHLSFGEWAATSSAGIALRLYAAVQHVGQRVQSVRSMLVHFGHVVSSGRLRLQDLLRQKETELAKTLADSSEPMVVTDDRHRILAANLAALTLLGVSRRNLNRFTIDAFLRPGQVRCFDRSGPRFIKSATRLGECEIKPLVGKPKVVEFSFQTDFLMGRHVSTFRDVVNGAPTGTTS
jgi:PAS domain-containing protein